jgi:hypothetical protein
MPYSIGERGSYGCSGYPVIKDDDKTVMGCHETMAQAQNQITAINMSESESSKKRLRSGIEGSIPAAPGPSVLDGQDYEEKDTVTNDGGIGIKNPQAWPGTAISEEERRRRKEQGNVWSGSFTPMSRQKSNYNDNTGDWFNAKPIPETSGFRNETETRDNISREIGKDMEIKEGDFVMGPTVDGMVYGMVEHIMWEGGTLGTPGTEYAMESMPPENPAMSVRVYEEDDDRWAPTPYSIGMMYQDAQVIDMDSMTMEQENEMEMMSKAETYSPNDGMKAAARRALKWKEDGEARGAGTPVGWGRARDIVAGRSMSLSVVRRMYSFFSRHEKSSKPAKGFRSGEEGYPSKGRVMWDAWGGDAGYSWSRAIVERNRDKSLFGDFFGLDNALKAKQEFAIKRERSMETRRRLAESGQAMPDGSYPIVTAEDLRNAIQAVGRAKDYEAARRHIMRRARALGMTDMLPEEWTGEKFWDIRDLTKGQGYTVKADSVRVGQMVSWNSSGGRAQGKVKRIIRNGSYNVPDSEFIIDGTEDNPAVVITLYRDGKPTDVTVAHRMSTLRAL